jgi:hypothetical protein
MSREQELLTALRSCGRELEKGFAFEAFAEASRLTWELFVQEPVEISQDTFRFVSCPEVEAAAERQIEGDLRRRYALLPDDVREKLSFEKMVQHECFGFAGFFLAINSGTTIGVYNHQEDRCYVLDTPTEKWRQYPYKFRPMIAVHELAHQWVTKKRASLGLRYLGAAYWEEKFCVLIEASLQGCAFWDNASEKFVSSRRKELQDLTPYLFDHVSEKLRYRNFIADCRHICSQNHSEGDC